MIELSAYTILEQLTEGGYSALFRAKRNSDSLPVIIKALRAEYPSVRDLLRLRHEYAIIGEVRGPGILLAHALERCGNGLALVLSDVGAKPLSELLPTLRGDYERILRVAINIVTALSTIHQHNVIHKDIKPHKVSIERET